MPSIKKNLKEEYDRLKKVFGKIVKPTREKTFPQPALQPIRIRKNF
jgi:hypothetical protein